ncbi:MAG: hypothetical protein JXB07_12735 [Anaerolineae bacterium]|nr:hypothetical protein [Anaerolineae bacterium]
MNRIFSGLISIMFLTLIACGAFTVRGEVMPAAQATQQKISRMSPAELQVADPNDETPIPTELPTVEPMVVQECPAGWQTYTNDAAGYRLCHPADAAISETGVMSYPPDELPEGKTPDEYFAELNALYGNSLCVSVSYGLGYVNISAPSNKEFRYAICGRTGVGVGEMIDKSDTIIIAGQPYTATGYEAIGIEEPCDLLPCHNETMVLTLPNDIRIEYGAAPVDDATFEDYLTGTRDVLRQIVASLMSD